MALNKIKTASITDQAVEKDKIKTDAIDATRIADDAVSEEHLDVTAITGNADLSTDGASNDVILVFDTSAGVIKKQTQSNFINSPSISSVSPTNAVSGDGTGNHTFTITGSGFTGASAKLINTSGTDVAFDTVTVNSNTQITAVIAKSSLLNSGEPFDVKVTAPNGLASTLENQINVDAQPVFATAAGSLANLAYNQAISTTDIVATDPESAGNVTFDKQSGTIPPGLSTTTVHENGVSKFRITGTPTTVSNDTTFNFTIRASDAASNTSSRAFSITVQKLKAQTFTSSGTFAIPSGTSSLDVLVVGGGGGGGGDNGGGGGAGGLVFMPGHPVTPGGTITVTVGSGGAGSKTLSPSDGRGQIGQNSAFGTPGDPGLNPGGLILTALAGGEGGGNAPSPGGGDGGSSGGGGGHNSGPAGSATQPTQPGNSGAYGFGNVGGAGVAAPRHAGGGGGSGGSGQPGTSCNAGGVGKAYTIGDGTTPVFYAGGGGGGRSGGTDGVENPGGQGGGGNGAASGEGSCGTANRGGGGGGGANGENPGGGEPTRGGGAGGKGIVIVRWT